MSSRAAVAIARWEPAFRGYIPELDSLRAIAAMAVLLFHFGPSVARDSLLSKLETSGWIGVDLFFVLSGFLITRILLETREEPNYYRNFYVRRTLRVFPLYYAGLFVWIALLILNEGIAGYRWFCEYWGNPTWFFVYLGIFGV